MLKRWSLVVVAGSAVTHAVYPWLYRDLVLGGGFSPLAVLLLVVRNAMVVWLFVEASRQAIRELRRKGDEQGFTAAERPLAVTS